MENRRGKIALMTTLTKLHKCLTTLNIVRLEFKTTISDKTIKKNKNYYHNKEEKKEKGK